MLPNLRSRLLTRPSMAILFCTGNMMASKVQQLVKEELPRDVQLIGAHTSSLQATNADTKMECCEEEDKVALMLGHFPEAECKAFFFDYDGTTKDKKDEKGEEEVRLYEQRAVLLPRSADIGRALLTQRSLMLFTSHFSHHLSRLRVKTKTKQSLPPRRHPGR